MPDVFPARGEASEALFILARELLRAELKAAPHGSHKIKFGSSSASQCGRSSFVWDISAGDLTGGRSKDSRSLRAVQSDSLPCLFKELQVQSRGE